MDFIIAYIYLLVTPMINQVIAILIELGLPKQQALWVQRDYAWAFGVLFVGVILWAIVWSYKREDDTGYRR